MTRGLDGQDGQDGQDGTNKKPENKIKEQIKEQISEYQTRECECSFVFILSILAILSILSNNEPEGRPSACAASVGYCPSRVQFRSNDAHAQRRGDTDFPD